MMKVIPDTGNRLTVITQSGGIKRMRLYASPVVPVISLGASLSGQEGNSGTTNFIFLAIRTGPASLTSTASWAVTGSGSTPANAADFVGGVFPSGTVTFAPGASLATITVPVAGDTSVEGDETFTVTLSNPSGATLGISTATGTILGDDSVPALVTSSPTSIAELQPIVATLVFNRPVTLTSITGTDGSLLTVAETGLQTTFTVKRLDGQNVNYEAKASYSYTMNVADAASNAASIPVVSNINNVDEQPDTTTFTPETLAAGETHYQTTYAVTGIPAGVTISLTLSGTGATFKNGSGSFGTAPITAQLNDVITIDVLSDGAAAGVRAAVLAGGDPSITIGTYTVTTAGSAQSTPTLANEPTRTLGTAPIKLLLSTSDYVAGKYAQIQVASDSAFSTITQNIVFFIDGKSWVLNDQSIAIQTENGQRWYRGRIASENADTGATLVTGTAPEGFAVSFRADASAWSSPFTDTINASVAVLFNGPAGVNRSHFVSVSPSTPRNFATTGGGGTQAVRTTQQQASTLASLEVTITAWTSGRFDVGIDNGTRNLDGGGIPGINDSTGWAVGFDANAVVVKHSSGTGSIVLASGAGQLQIGDVAAIWPDISAHTIKVWRKRGASSPVLIGTATGLPALSAAWGFVGSEGVAVQGVINPGADAYVIPLDPGMPPIWA
jgi:hypothetical protein